MTTKRKRSNEAAPVTGVATGSLGTAANLDDTQVLRMEELEATGPPRMSDEPAPAAHPPVMTPAPQQDVTPVRPGATARGRSRSGQPTDRRRGMALVGMGALATLFVLGGAGILSQLDLRAIGTEPSTPALGVTTAPPPTAAVTPEPREAAGKGKGSCHGNGKHCRGAGQD